MGFCLDISRMKFPDDLFEKMRPQIEHAFAAMRELGAGEIVHQGIADKGKTAEQIARSVDADPEDVFHSLRHLPSNDLRINVATDDESADDRFSLGPFK